MDCFEHLHKENTEPLVNVSVSHVQPQAFFMVFTEGRGGVMEFKNRTGMLIFL